MNEKFVYVIYGILALLFVKYILFGLTSWDSIFHPDRIEPQDSPFLQPMLGVFTK